jgi:hypothetical protein
MTHREDECELKARRDWANAEGLTCDARLGHRVFMTPPYARRGAEAPSAQQEAFMELREKAAALATKRAGRCTCALMDDGMDCHTRPRRTHPAAWAHDQAGLIWLSSRPRTLGPAAGAADEPSGLGLCQDAPPNSSLLISPRA